MDFSIEPMPMEQSAFSRWTAFLRSRGLRWEPGVQWVALLTQEDQILACGALRGKTLCLIAVDPSIEGEDACAKIVTALVTKAYQLGQTHLFLCTKPIHERIFRSFGFYPLAQTSDMLLMENQGEGLKRYLKSIPVLTGLVGAVVLNGNPFTLGHQRLLEYASAHCDGVYAFVLSEEGARFSSEERFELAKAGTAHLPNCRVVRSGEYLVSRATFPAYFIKEEGRVQDARAELDLALFWQRIAPALGITRRFVGAEPYCPVTRAYNAQMQEILPQHGISVTEVPRSDGISASSVRKLMDAGDLAAIRPLVPEETYRLIQKKVSVHG